MRATSTMLGLVAALATTSLLASPARAQGARTPSHIDLAHRAEELRPGQWIWAPEISPAGPVVIHVDLSRQLTTVYRNGVRIGVAPSSSGRRGYETPSGVFTVLQKSARHRSNLYNNAPMPYMLRLTWDGVALHGGAVRDSPVSHGCVRLPLAFARELFQVAPMGGTVVVEGEAGGSTTGPGAGVLAPVGVGGVVHTRTALRIGQSYSWTPEASPFGPVTVIMSAPDQQVVVLRNGVEIGRARAFIPSDGGATRLLTYDNSVEGAPRWTDADAPGNRAAEAPGMGIVDRVRLPVQFEEAMAQVLTPGTTMLITHAPISDGDVEEIPSGPVPVFDAAS